jgi:excisionase family DNA binding protein
MGKKSDKLLPVSIVAERLGVCKQSVYNSIISGFIPAIRVGAKAGIRIFESDLENFLQQRKTEYEEPAQE